jgi:hypothetical protein
MLIVGVLLASPIVVIGAVRASPQRISTDGWAGHDSREGETDDKHRPVSAWSAPAADYSAPTGPGLAIADT